MKNLQKKIRNSEYATRKTEMGILTFHCLPTGDTYLIATKDKRVTINSNLVQLRNGMHPNKELQTLWNTYGEATIQIELVERLPFDEERLHCEEYIDDLKELLEVYHLLHNDMKLVWKWARI